MTGAGVGLATPAMAAAAMAAVPQTRAGMAGGALNTSRQLGNALGIAVLGAVFRSGLLGSLRTDHSLPDPRHTADALTGGQAGPLIAHTPDLAHPVDAAFATGLRDAFLLSGALGLLGGAAVLLLLRRPAAPETPLTAPAAAAAPART